MCSRADELRFQEYVDAGLRWLDRRMEEHRDVDLRALFERVADCTRWEDLREAPRRRPAGPVRWV
jgi:hypothetical protein